MTEPRTCPVPGCGAPLRGAYLMCKECWTRTPLKLQRGVHRAWRAFRKRGDVLAHSERLRSYIDAVDAAVRASEAAR
jgi:hypothetical protein